MSAELKTLPTTVVVEKPVAVILELTLEETVVLRDILKCIGGNAFETARAHADSIKDKLGF